MAHRLLHVRICGSGSGMMACSTLRLTLSLPQSGAWLFAISTSRIWLPIKKKFHKCNRSRAAAAVVRIINGNVINISTIGDQRCSRVFLDFFAYYFDCLVLISGRFFKPLETSFWNGLCSSNSIDEIDHQRGSLHSAFSTNNGNRKTKEA